MLIELVYVALVKSLFIRNTMVGVFHRQMDPAEIIIFEPGTLAVQYPCFAASAAPPQSITKRIN